MELKFYINAQGNQLYTGLIRKKSFPLANNANYKDFNALVNILDKEKFDLRNINYCHKMRKQLYGENGVRESPKPSSHSSLKWY